MGRIGAANRGDGPFPANDGLAHAANSIRGDGALARMAGRDLHRGWDVVSQETFGRDPLVHLSHLLTPLHDEPDILAARLLHRFGSIGRIVQASDSELRHAATADERWADTLLMVRRLIHDGMREKLVRTKLGEDREALCSYLLSTMRHLPDERMLAIFADTDGFVIAEEIIGEGSAAHVFVTPRKVFTRALNLDARKILLAHNHPSGCAEPSTFDIRHTRLLKKQATGLGLVIVDHLIIGAGVITSMKDRGMF